jgi:acyl-CoA synthetase (NDP forming)
VKQKYPHAVIDGVSVQKMARPGTEVIIGMTKDAQFGPVLMFGLGGILVELLKDVSFRIVPLEREDAREMIREIKGYPILEGFRGMEPADVSILEEILLKISRFVDDHPEIKELDLNPIFAYRDGAIAADARVVLEGNALT